MIAFLLALLLWMLGHGPAPSVPAPAPHGVTVPPAAPAPAAVAPTPSHGRASAGGARPGVPAQRSAAAPTVAEPAPVLDSPVMCTDPVDCPHLPAPPVLPPVDSPVMCPDPVDCPPGR